MEEKELVEASRAGDEEAFSLLVRKYQRKVLSMAFHFTRDSQVADDLAQEIFMKTYFSLPSFKFRSEFGTWLYRIAINHIKDYLRKRNRLKEVSLNKIKEPSVSYDQSIAAEERERQEEEKRNTIRRLIEVLPEKARLILTLRDIQGFSYGEIAKTLNISMGTVDSRLFRARKMLRERFTKSLRKKGGNDGL